MLSVRGSMSAKRRVPGVSKTIPTHVAFWVRQFQPHAKNDNNVTRGFKEKGSNYNGRNNPDMLPKTEALHRERCALGNMPPAHLQR